MDIKKAFENMDYGPAPESEKEARDWLASRDHKFGHFIDGAFTDPGASEGFSTHNPADGGFLAQIANGSAEDVDRAVASARKAQGPWEKLGGPGRARYLYALARLVQKNSRLLAVVESLDNGKPIRESRDIDIPLVARHFYHHAGWAQLIEAEFPGHKAVGVAGQVIPWNFPLLMLSWKLAPALAAGNTVVLKPAEYTPLTALLFAELCVQAGLPKGVVNIVTGEGETGALVSGHPDVNKVAFTGSTEVGRIIRRQTAGQGKKLTLELGGKSPNLVFADCDLEERVTQSVAECMFNTGQSCDAPTRLLVERACYDEAVDIARRAAEATAVGDPEAEGDHIGPLFDQIQFDRVQNMIQVGIDEGATLLVGGLGRPEGFDAGWYVRPTVFSDVNNSMRIAREEIFGPVLAIIPFDDEDEAVAIANDTPYGLAAYVQTGSNERAARLSRSLRAGAVHINGGAYEYGSPFGGYKASGNGREGGEMGLEDFLETKMVHGLA